MPAGAAVVDAAGLTSSEVVFSGGWVEALGESTVTIAGGSIDSKDFVTSAMKASLPCCEGDGFIVAGGGGINEAIFDCTGLASMRRILVTVVGDNVEFSGLVCDGSVAIGSCGVNPAGGAPGVFGWEE